MSMIRFLTACSLWTFCLAAGCSDVEPQRAFADPQPLPSRFQPVPVESPEERNRRLWKTKWKESYQLAEALASPHIMTRLSTTQQMADHLRHTDRALRVSNANTLRFRDSLAKIRNAHTKATSLVAQMQQIEEEFEENALEGGAHFVDALAETTKPEEDQSALPLLQTAWKVGVGVGQYQQHSELAGQLRQTEYNLRNGAANTFPVFDSHSQARPYKASEGLLSVDYFPSWYGAYAKDLVLVTNTGNEVIHDAVLCVLLLDSQLRPDAHLHTVDQLRPGEDVEFRYNYWSSDCFYSSTRDDIRTVAVMLASRDHRGTYRWKFSQDKHDTWVEASCKDLTFTGGCLKPFAGNWLLPREQPGFQLRFAGLSRLPTSEVEVELQYPTGLSKALYWKRDTGSFLERDENYNWRSKQYWPSPTKAIVRLRFRDSDYEHEICWDL